VTTSEPPGTTDLLALAESIAREAGASLRDAFASLGSLEISTKSTATDLVSDADVATERLIRARLHESRPGDAILGEEGGEGEGTTGLRWVVDPLDGTVNFLFGIPQWAVSIACEDAGGTLIGVVYDAERDELFSAERGGPPTLDGRPITSSIKQDLATALVGTGFGYDAEVRRAQAAVVAGLLPHCRDVRRFGAAAIDLAWTACGRLDAYYEHGLNPWDLAAGGLICQCAGLELRDLDPVGPSNPGVVVGPPTLVDALVPYLR
jgi:myo-inositol-1(or 4)-monophosphatase